MSADTLHDHTGSRRADDPEAIAQERSLGDLLGELTDEAAFLFRQEVALAKLELKRDAKEAGQAGGLLGAGAVLGYLALTLVLFAASWGLAEIMPTGLAFLIVGLVTAAGAAALALAGRKRLQRLDPAPRATIDTLREDKEWISNASNAR